MPKIEPYQQRVSITGEAPSAKANLLPDVGSTGKGISSIGQGIGNLGAAIQERREKLDKQDDAITSLTVANSIDDAEMKFWTNHKQTKTGRDAFNSIDDVNTFFDDQNKNLSEVIEKIKDPLQKAKVNNYLQDKKTALSYKAASFINEQKGVVAEQTIEQTTQGSLNAVYQGYSEAKAEIASYSGKIKDLFTTGLISKEKAEAVIIKGSQGIAEAEVDKMVNSNPAAFTELNKRGTWDNVLPKAKLDEFDKKANTIKEKMSRDTEHAELKAKQLKIDTELSAVENLESNFGTEYRNGTLTLAKIEKSKPMDFKDWSPQAQNSLNTTALRYTQLFKSEQERIKRELKKEAVDPFKKSDSVIYAKIRKQIELSPETVKAIDILELTGEGLSKSDSEKLIKIHEAALKDDVNSPRKLAKKRTIDSIQADYKLGLYGDKNSQEAAIKASETETAFLSWYSDPENFKKDPMEWYKTNRKEEADGFVMKILKGVGELTGVYKKPLPEKVKGKVIPKGETTDKYQKGKSYKDAQGREAEYLGNGKWKVIK